MHSASTLVVLLTEAQLLCLDCQHRLPSMLLRGIDSRITTLFAFDLDGRFVRLVGLDAVQPWTREPDGFWRPAVAWVDFAVEVLELSPKLLQVVGATALAPLVGGQAVPVEWDGVEHRFADAWLDGLTLQSRDMEVQRVRLRYLEPTLIQVTIDIAEPAAEHAAR